MEHVKVPVPEGMVAEVAQFLQWRQWNTSKTDLSGFDVEVAASLLDSLDEPARQLVLHAAECAAEAVVFTVPDAVAVGGLSEREVLGLVIQFNDAVRRAGGSWIALAANGTSEQGPNGWTLNMPSDVAEFFLMAAGRGGLARGSTADVGSPEYDA